MNAPANHRSKPPPRREVAQASLHGQIKKRRLSNTIGISQNARHAPFITSTKDTLGQLPSSCPFLAFICRPKHGPIILDCMCSILLRWKTISGRIFEETITSTWSLSNEHERRLAIHTPQECRQELRLYLFAVLSDCGNF